MQGILMDRRVSVWRKVLSGSGISQSFPATEIIKSLTAGIVPISAMDVHVEFAHESTHVIWVPYWIRLRKEDEVRTGRDDPDFTGNVNSFVFTIVGRRDFRMGIPQLAYYARQLD